MTGCFLHGNSMYIFLDCLPTVSGSMASVTSHSVFPPSSGTTMMFIASCRKWHICCMVILSLLFFLYFLCFTRELNYYFVSFIHLSPLLLVHNLLCVINMFMWPAREDFGSVHLSINSWAGLMNYGMFFHKLYWYQLGSDVKLRVNNFSFLISEWATS